MNDAHLHLLVNHIPIVGGGFAAIVMAWGLIRKNRSIIHLALVLFVVLGVASAVAQTTGEGAEEIVEETMPYVDHGTIHAHEEAAFIAHITMIVTALVALVTLIVRKLRDMRVLHIVTLVLALAAAVLMVRAGYLGGFITHTEVSH